MTAITLDTLNHIEQLEASGIPAAQAEAFVNARREILADGHFSFQLLVLMMR